MSGAIALKDSSPPVRRKSSHGKRPSTSVARQPDKTKPQPKGAASVEQQYVRNLQQQIQLLELENSYLRNELENSKGGAEAKHTTDRSSSPVKLSNGNGSNKSSPEDHRKNDRRLHEESIEERDQALERVLQIKDRSEEEKYYLEREVIELRRELDTTQTELAKAQQQHNRHHTIQEERDEEDTHESSDHYNNHHNNGRQPSPDNTTELNALTSQSIARQTEAALKEEISNLNETLKHLEQQLKLISTDAGESQDESLMLKKALRQFELQAKLEKELGEKVMLDNERLIQDNSELLIQLQELNQTSKTNDKSQLTASISHSDLAGLRQREQHLSGQVLEQEHSIKEQTAKLAKSQEQLSGLREQHERLSLHNSQVLNQLEQNRLTDRQQQNELKQLRQENHQLRERLEHLTDQITAKEAEVREFKSRLHSLEQYYTRVLREWEHDAQQKSRDFEHLALRANDMSNDLKHQTNSALDIIKN